MAKRKQPWVSPLLLVAWVYRENRSGLESDLQRLGIWAGYGIGRDDVFRGFAFVGDLAEADVFELRPDQADGNDCEEGNEKQCGRAGNGSLAGDSEKV